MAISRRRAEAVAQAAALFAVCTVLMLRCRQDYLSDGPARLALIGAGGAVIFPVILALFLRIDRVAMGRLLGFTAGMLVPLLAVCLAPRTHGDFQWLASLALWGAVLVTIYSFFDYITGFRKT